MNRTQDCLIFGIWSLNECLSLSLFPFSPGLLSYNINWYVVYGSCLHVFVLLYIFIYGWLIIHCVTNENSISSSILNHCIPWRGRLSVASKSPSPAVAWCAAQTAPWISKITLVKKETLLCRYLIGIEYYIMPYGSLLMSPNSQGITCDSINKTTATGPQRRMVQF